MDADVLEQRLWLEYRGGQAAAREQLITRYLPLAKRIAAGLFARRKVDDVEFGDYLQLAHVGLLEALQRYDADSPAQFATFATLRIRGSILNGVTKMTETGERLGYLRRAHRDRARSLAAQQTSSGDLASLLEMVVTMALTCQLDEIAEAAVEPDTVVDPYASRLYQDTQRRLHSALAGLPERERQLIELHYFHQVGFEELAAAMGVSKGRVSQLHGRALASIRQTMAKHRLAEFI